MKLSATIKDQNPTVKAFSVMINKQTKHKANQGAQKAPEARRELHE
jgi:hypothetical protein